jgi:hypothetical protein
MHGPILCSSRPALVGILVHRPIGERVETVAAVATDRQPVWTHSRHVVECRRVIPGAESELACVSAAAISANAEFARAQSLCAERPIHVRRFRHHEYAIALGEYGFPIVMVKFWGLRNDPALLSAESFPADALLALFLGNRTSCQRHIAVARGA